MERSSKYTNSTSKNLVKHFPKKKQNLLEAFVQLITVWSNTNKSWNCCCNGCYSRKALMDVYEKKTHPGLTKNIICVFCKKNSIFLFLWWIFNTCKRSAAIFSPLLNVRANFLWGFLFFLIGDGKQSAGLEMDAYYILLYWYIKTLWKNLPYCMIHKSFSLMESKF